MAGAITSAATHSSSSLPLLTAHVYASGAIRTDGTEQLPVLPWRVDFDGLWLGMDMFFGVSSLLFAFSIAGIQHTAVVLEQERDLKQAAASGSHS